jgi:outer membrane protein assembly factor BamB
VKTDEIAAPRLPPTDEKTRWDRYGSAIVTDANRLYVASRDRNLYALDIKTGAIRWKYTASDIMTATPALYRDLVLIADYAGKVQALGAADGKLRWTYDAKLAVPGDLVVDGDRVLVGSRSYDLIALNAGTGRELWKHYYWFSWIESPPVVRDGVIYTGSSDATRVFAIDEGSGKLRWKTAVPGWAWPRTAVNDRLRGGGRFRQRAHTRDFAPARWWRWIGPAAPCAGCTSSHPRRRRWMPGSTGVTWPRR